MPVPVVDGVALLVGMGDVHVAFCPGTTAGSPIMAAAASNAARGSFPLLLAPVPAVLPREAVDDEDGNGRLKLNALASGLRASAACRAFSRSSRSLGESLPFTLLWLCEAEASEGEIEPVEELRAAVPSEPPCCPCPRDEKIEYSPAPVAPNVLPLPLLDCSPSRGEYAATPPFLPLVRRDTPPDPGPGAVPAPDPIPGYNGLSISSSSVPVPGPTGKSAHEAPTPMPTDDEPPPSPEELLENCLVCPADGLPPLSRMCLGKCECECECACACACALPWLLDSGGEGDAGISTSSSMSNSWLGISEAW